MTREEEEQMANKIPAGCEELDSTLAQHMPQLTAADRRALIVEAKAANKARGGA